MQDNNVMDSAGIFISMKMMPLHLMVPRVHAEEFSWWKHPETIIFKELMQLVTHIPN